MCQHRFGCFRWAGHLPFAEKVQSGANTPHSKVMSVVVFKIGGSLLDLPDLAVRLRQLLAQLEGHQPLLVCGGGIAADMVRQWHRDFKLSEERCHWLALEAIRLNQHLLLELLPECKLIATRDTAASAWQRGRVPLLDLVAFVRDEESQLSVDDHLSHNWNVTSDSLAAWVARRWHAQRLTLLKSTNLPPTTNWQQAADAGLVDPHFPQAVKGIPFVEWLNLRYAA